MPIRSLALVALALALGGCLRHGTCEDEPDNRFCRDAAVAPRDASTADAGPDGGTMELDADTDGGTDAGASDGGTDAGPPDAGPCDGCPDGGLCEMEAGLCVECLGDDDCTSPSAARCGGGSCTGCDDSSQCAGITGTEVCDPGSGECEECVGSERTACGAFVCDPDRTCSTTVMARSASACALCFTDDQCQLGQLCVPASEFEGGGSEGRCLWRQDATGTGAPNGSCLSIAALIAPRSVTSVDGVAATVCTLRVGGVTCQAYLDRAGRETCTSRADTSCGDGGGLCRENTGTGSPYLCTYECIGPGSSDDCQGGLCVTDAMGGDPYCQI